MKQDIFSDIKAFAFDIDGVFTDGSILAMPDGDLLRTFNTKDCFAVRMAVDAGYPVAIITGGCSNSLIFRAQSLGVRKEDLYQMSKDKETDFLLFCRRHGLKAENVAFAGDDLPDIPAIKAAGLGVCPADAVPEVKEASDFISPFNGGRGCIRHLIESVLKEAGNWAFDPHTPWTGNYPEEIMKLGLTTGKHLK